MKEWVRGKSNGKFSIGLRASNWKLDNGEEISIDVIDDAMVSPFISTATSPAPYNTVVDHPTNSLPLSQSEFKPVGYKKPSEINSAGDLPFVSKADLLTDKLIACSERTIYIKGEQDAKDAKQIVDADGNPNLSDAQKKLIVDKGCMDKVYEHSDTDAKWWAEKAGLDGLVNEDDDDDDEEEDD